MASVNLQRQQQNQTPKKMQHNSQSPEARKAYDEYVELSFIMTDHYAGPTGHVVRIFKVGTNEVKIVHIDEIGTGRSARVHFDKDRDADSFLEHVKTKLYKFRNWKVPQSVKKE